MKCEQCGNATTEVVDSRGNEKAKYIRRRRKCPNCDERFSTYEITADAYLLLSAAENATMHLERAGAHVLSAIDSIREAKNPSQSAIVSEFRLEALASKLAP